MTMKPPLTSPTAMRIRAAMRAWLRRRMAARAVGRLANPFLRLSRAMDRAPAARRFRICTPGLSSLTIRTTPGPKPLSALGLGLAGGGGGDPGARLV